MPMMSIVVTFTNSSHSSLLPHSGNIFKMSRNKDKYENNNPRRQQVFMSAEDVAAGRKTNWHGVEITGE